MRKSLEKDLKDLQKKYDDLEDQLKVVRTQFEEKLTK